MTGLFGGGGGKVVVQQPTQTVDKSAEKAEKEEKKRKQEQLERKNAYGQSTSQFKPVDDLLTGTDNTLSSGSLLSLGGKLGG